MLPRRSLLTGIALLTAPSIVRASSLMPIMPSKDVLLIYFGDGDHNNGSGASFKRKRYISYNQNVHDYIGKLSLGEAVTVVDSYTRRAELLCYCATGRWIDDKDYWPVVNKSLYT